MGKYGFNADGTSLAPMQAVPGVSEAFTATIECSPPRLATLRDPNCETIMRIIKYQPTSSLSTSAGKDPARAAGIGTTYSLTLENRSNQNWTFYVYQEQPQPTSNVFSLAWFASPWLIRPGGDSIKFEWTIDYNFVWSATGSLQPGVTFTASGVKNADPSGPNTTTFDLAGGAPGLTDPVVGPPAGSLVILDGADVPANTFSVGIGMSGVGTYAVQAGANLKHQFTPTPNYWIAAGTNIQVGDVLDIQTVSQNEQIVFPPSVFALTYTLNDQNLWVQS